MAECVVTHWDDLAVEESGGVGRALFGGSGADLRRVAIPAGTRAERHEHPHEQFLMVLEGAALLTTAEGCRELRPGSLVRLAAGAWHAAEFRTATVLVEVNLRQEEECGG